MKNKKSMSIISKAKVKVITGTKKDIFETIDLSYGDASSVDYMAMVGTHIRKYLQNKYNKNVNYKIIGFF